MATQPSCSSSSKEAKKTRCLRRYVPFEARAGTWFSRMPYFPLCGAAPKARSMIDLPVPPARVFIGKPRSVDR